MRSGDEGPPPPTRCSITSSRRTGLENAAASHVFVLDLPGFGRRCSSPTRRSTSPRLDNSRSTSSRTRSISPAPSASPCPRSASSRRSRRSTIRRSLVHRRGEVFQDGRARPDPVAAPTGFTRTHRRRRGREQAGTTPLVAGHADVLIAPTPNPATCWPSELVFSLRFRLVTAP